MGQTCTRTERAAVIGRGKPQQLRKTGFDGDWREEAVELEQSKIYSLSIPNVLCLPCVLHGPHLSI